MDRWMDAVVDTVVGRCSSCNVAMMMVMRVVLGSGSSRSHGTEEGSFKRRVLKKAQSNDNRTLAHPRQQHNQPALASTLPP